MSEIHVYKNNSLINTKTTWETQEQKLFNVLLSDINNRKEKSFSLTKRELEEILCKSIKEDYKKKGEADQPHLNLTHLRKLSRDMVKKGFSVNISKDEWEDIQIFEKISYKQGVMTMHLTNAAMPYLYELTSYTRYMLDDILSLKKGYSIRIFELLKRETFKKRKSFTITVKDLREFIGIGEKEYARFTDFDQKVLEPAKEEINARTKMKFSYNKIKKWRTVEEIEFIYENIDNVKIPKYIDFREFSQHQKEKIMSIGVAKTIEINRRNGWSIQPEEYIKAQVIKTKASNPDNIFGYLMQALENDWAELEDSRNLKLNQISFDDVKVDEKKKPKKKTPQKRKSTKDFEEREYDYDDLERKLLGWDNLEEIKN